MNGMDEDLLSSEWDVVPPDWWRTSFEDVSWAPHRRRHPHSWASPGYIAPLPLYLKSHSPDDTNSEGNLELNAALAGYQGAEDAMRHYELNTGFYAEVDSGAAWDWHMDHNTGTWDTLMNELNPTLVREDLPARYLQESLQHTTFDPFESHHKRLNAQATPFIFSDSTSSIRVQRDAQGFYSRVEDSPKLSPAPVASKRRSAAPSRTRAIIESMSTKGYASTLKHRWSEDELDLSEDDGWIGERSRTSKNLFKTLNRHRSESIASTSTLDEDVNNATFEVTLLSSSPSPTLSSNDGWIEGIPSVKPDVQSRQRKRPPPLHRKRTSASSISSSSSASSAPLSAQSPMFAPYGAWTPYYAYNGSPVYFES